MDKLTEYITSYSTAIKYEDLSPEVIHKAKGLLIDTLGCAIGGYSSEPAKIARRMAGIVHSEIPGTIIGSGQETSLDLATFANGIMIRYLDFNDGFVSTGGGHPSDLFAPVLTCADAVCASGKDVLVAAILAYEIFCRWDDEVNLSLKSIDHTVPGIIAAAMGASKILGLSQSEMVQALNLTIAPNIALEQTRVGEVSMWKGCAMANASRNAVFAALLASEGMTGPAPIFEGRHGLFNAITGPFELQKFGGKGRPFRMMDATIKRYPFGQLAQTAADAAVKLRSKISSINDITQVNIDSFDRAMNIMAGDEEKWHPTTRETADHSMPYVVAVALMYGTVEARHFDDEYLKNPELMALVQKIKAKEDTELTKLYPDANANRLELVTKSGQKFVETVKYHRGHFRNPLTDEEIEAKFNSLTRELLLPEQRKELCSTIWHLEELDDACEIMELLRI